jgi:lipopolysaccharide transport system ATP-binding protein
MNKTAIEVAGLSKKYKIGLQQRARYKSLRDTLADLARKPLESFKRRKGGAGAEPKDREFWALRDVSFEVGRGEVVGVIGRNGAGKSTLLKVLSRITEPTTGHGLIYGRVGSLLEVGSGFHPELTGRENIFMNGAILGMRRAEIERKFDEIVAFAEIDKFVDTPVKRYSSGMYMRLAFAVAAHLEPEILIIDEVLAVGDAAFQKKCLGKMGSVADQGRTVLFVSHNMTALQALCSRAIWLSGGEVQEDGPAAAVVTRYLQANTETMLDQTWDDSDPKMGHAGVRLHRARVMAKEPFHITVADPLDIEITYSNYVPGMRLNLSLHLFNLEGTCVFSSVSPVEAQPAGRIRAVCRIPGDLLNDSYYRVHVMIVKDTSVVLLQHFEAIQFEVYDVPREYSWYGKWAGALRPKLQWEIEFAEDAEQNAPATASSLTGAGRI